MLISPPPVSQCAKMNKARVFQPPRKATAELPMGLLPLGPQCRGGWLGGLFTAAASQYGSSLVFFPCVTKPDTVPLRTLKITSYCGISNVHKDTRETAEEGDHLWHISLG